MHENKCGAVAIQIVLASTHAGDRETLESLLAGSPWELIAVANVEQTLRALHRLSVPIALCDQNLDDQPWQETVRALIKARRKTSITVLTDAGGPGLWADLARRGGFDLLARPFERDQVYATLMCAYAQCRMSWPVITTQRPVPMANASK
jgi:DNA-binding NtrC family response regulator